MQGVFDPPPWKMIELAEITSQLHGLTDCYEVDLKRLEKNFCMGPSRMVSHISLEAISKTRIQA